MIDHDWYFCTYCDYAVQSEEKLQYSGCPKDCGGCLEGYCGCMCCKMQLEKATGEPKIFETELREAHKHSTNNRRSIEMSSMVACFCCKRTYPPSKITEWTDSDQTAICPCGIDSVYSNASGIPLAAEFIEKMNEFWFGTLTKSTTQRPTG